jgi:hypothetical protein
MVKTGDDAKPGTPAVKLADKRMTADFKLPAADATSLKPGAAVQLAPAGGKTTIAGRVAKVEGETVTVEIIDEASAKPGDSLKLVKSTLPNVFPVASTAVVKRDGADTVFVLVNGEAKARKVTVVDHDGPNALITSGLASGDSYITNPGDALADGKKATTSP